MNYILVVGSKPDSILPNLEVKKVYTANGAAERGRIYKKKFLNTKLITVVGAKEFLKNELVQKYIIDSDPNEVIVRTGKIDQSFFKKDTNLNHLNWSQQLDIQKKFLILSPLCIFLAELINWRFTSRDPKFQRKLLHLLITTAKGEFWGISTGFFTILYALHENPNSKIIVTGIGLSGGKQFYKSERSKIYDYFPRSRVDRFIAKFLRKEIKNKIFSMDGEFVDNVKCNKWKDFI